MEPHNDTHRPRVVNVTLASALGAYLMRTQELGVVEGTEGALVLNPVIQPVLEALHHVLAGGEVEVRIVRPGNPDIVEELNRRAAQATEEASTLNKAAGFYLTGTV